MNFISIEQFTPYVLADMPACPENLVEREIMSTIINFCEESNIWAVEMTPLHVLEGIHFYEFEVPHKASLVRPSTLNYCGKKLDELGAANDMDQCLVGWRERTGTPHGYIMDDNVTARLYPTPEKDKEYALTGVLRLRPIRSGTEVPEFIYEEWLEAIEHGTKARLFNMPNKEWTDKGLSAFHKLEYRRITIDARIDQLKANGVANLRVPQRRVISRY